MSGTVTGTTRALACLALGHDDEHASRCSSSDEDLVRSLVEEVQALRVAAGVVEESEVDRAERAEVVSDAIGRYLDEQRVPLEEGGARDLLLYLDASGWTLHPVRRP